MADLTQTNHTRRSLATACAIAVACGADAQTLTLRYANDYFAAADQYFTQGIYLGVDGERPYAGTFYLGARTWRHPSPQQTWTFDALLGVIGPAALGEEQQSGIHRAIEDKIPMGWRHQIQNGCLLDVGAGFRQNLLSCPRVAADVTAEARLGTFRTRLVGRLRFGARARARRHASLAADTPGVRFREW